MSSVSNTSMLMGMICLESRKSKSVLMLVKDQDDFADWEEENE
jgi:hypothetical protein